MEPQEERNGAVNGHLLKCSSYNGIECDCGMIPKKRHTTNPQHRPGDRRKEWEERFEKINDIDWEYIYELKRVKSAELEADDFEEVSNWMPQKIKAFISQEIKLTLAAYKDAIMKEKQILRKEVGFPGITYISVESIERISGDFGL